MLLLLKGLLLASVLGRARAGAAPTIEEHDSVPYAPIVSLGPHPWAPETRADLDLLLAPHALLYFNLALPLGHQTRF